MTIPHDWNLTPPEAIALQKSLASQVDTHTPIDLERVELVAGVDVSVKDNISRAAVVVLRIDTLAVVDSALAQMPTPFPYISGLLTFREGQVILDAHAKLKTRPDAYIFDGMGIMHPRRLGVAAHMGLWLDAPTVGCGKTHLLGSYDTPAPERGAFQPVTHKGEMIGIVLRTRAHTKPVYISPGHRATIESARELVMRCSPKYRLPEPIRAAHNLAGL